MGIRMAAEGFEMIGGTAFHAVNIVMHAIMCIDSADGH